MNREDVDWRGYWPACPTPFTARGALDLESLRGSDRVVRRPGNARHLHQRHLRRVVLAVARGTASRRRDGDRPGCGPDHDRDRLHVAHREGGGRARPARARGRRRRDRLDAAALLEDVPRRDGALLPGHLGRRRGAAHGLQLAARHERRHRPGSRRAARRRGQRRRDQGQHAQPGAVLRDDAEGAGRRPRLRPLHERRRPRLLARARRRRLHRRRLALGSP